MAFFSFESSRPVVVIDTPFGFQPMYTNSPFLAPPQPMYANPLMLPVQREPLYRPATVYRTVDPCGDLPVRHREYNVYGSGRTGVETYVDGRRIESTVRPNNAPAPQPTRTTNTPTVPAPSSKTIVRHSAWFNSQEGKKRIVYWSDGTQTVERQ